MKTPQATAASEPRRLPMLANVRVASPCSASWDAMTGDDRVRFCGGCEKNVYNLSNMSADDAEALLVSHEGRICVRFYERADGTVMTDDCPVGVRTKRRRAALTSVASAFAMAVSACASAEDAEPRATMGEMVAMPPIATTTSTTSATPAGTSTHSPKAMPTGTPRTVKMGKFQVR